MRECLMFNKDLTIVNKYFNKQTKDNEYKLSYIKGFWSSNNGIIISNTNLVKNDGFKASILMSEDGYVNPKEYTGKDNTWTLQNDDYLVKGIVKEITTLAKLKQDYECMKITNVSIKDYGSLDMQHFEVSGE